MNFIAKTVLFIKNIFKNKEKVKKKESPKQIPDGKEKDNFIEYLKINTTEKRNKKEVETLICKGDGLGIKKKISC